MRSLPLLFPNILLLENDAIQNVHHLNLSPFSSFNLWILRIELLYIFYLKLVIESIILYTFGNNFSQMHFAMHILVFFSKKWVDLRNSPIKLLPKSIWSGRKILLYLFTHRFSNNLYSIPSTIKSTPWNHIVNLNLFLILSNVLSRFILLGW